MTRHPQPHPPPTSTLTDAQRWALKLAAVEGWGVVAEGGTTAVQLCSGSPRRALVIYVGASTDVTSRPVDTLPHGPMMRVLNNLQEKQ